MSVFKLMACFFNFLGLKSEVQFCESPLLKKILYISIWILLAIKKNGLLQEKVSSFQDVTWELEEVLCLSSHYPVSCKPLLINSPHMSSIL